MALGSLVSIAASTINRVMVVELSLLQIIPGLLLALHYFIQISRPNWGFLSDKGGNRTFWIIIGVIILCLGSILACIGILFEEPKGLSFKFSLPNKLFDYIHSNTPILATPLKEVKRIVDHYQVGEYIYERSPEVVANQIKKMSKNIDEYKFTQAKKDLNWQDEFKNIECVFSPLLDKA